MNDMKIAFLLEAACFLAFAGMALTAYLILGREKLMKDCLETVYKRISEGDRIKLDEIKRFQRFHGETDKKTLFVSLNRRLGYSGILTRLPWLNTSMAAAAALAGIPLLFLIGTIGTGKWQMAAGITICVPAALHGILIFVMDANYRNTEKDLIPFMNLVENFSITEDDLISILEAAGGYVGDPIRSHVKNAVYMARREGDAVLALRNLREGMEHKYFKKLIRNLEICSRHTANYKEIVNDCRGATERQLDMEQEKKAIFQNARFELCAIVAVGVGLIFMMSSFLESEKNIFILMAQQLPGQILIGYLGFMTAVAAWFCVFRLKQH